MTNNSNSSVNLIIEKAVLRMLKEKLVDPLIKSVTGISQDDLDRIKNKL